MPINPSPECLFLGPTGTVAEGSLLAPRPMATNPPDTHDEQPFPRSGPLAAYMNVSLDRLLNAICDYAGDVYCHTLDALKYGRDSFHHVGSGPNFQGGVITLCTCKPRMRSLRTPERWKGTWVAGFAGINTVGDGRNYLVYLMRVGQAYESQRDLWHALPDHVRRAKAAHLRRHGDVFQPSLGLRDPFSSRHYLAPRPDHVDCREGNWLAGADFVRRTRQPALLIGEERASFLWEQPTIYSSFRMHGGQRKSTFRELLLDLHRA